VQPGVYRYDGALRPNPEAVSLATNSAESQQRLRAGLEVLAKRIKAEVGQPVSFRVTANDPNVPPLEPYFRQARQAGAIEVMEIDEGMMLLGLRAAAWGLPYIPTEVGLGTDIITRNPDIKVIDSPYDDKEWVAMPALRLDAALLHVDRADIRGVCQIAGPDHYMDDWYARAAEHTYVSCDELVATEFFHDPVQARLVYWERAATSGVVHIPGGAHPTSCNPAYGFDVPHFKAYVASAGEGGIQAYLDEYLGRSEQEYQQKVGGLDAIRALPLPTY
jgi:glutaconate CoA-transferase subunit A